MLWQRYRQVSGCRGSDIMYSVVIPHRPLHFSVLCLRLCIGVSVLSD